MSTASKPAGLAKLAPDVIPAQGWAGCPWGTAYDEMAHGYVPACFNAPADNAAAPKTAGLAKLAPDVISEQGWAGCPWGTAYDEMAHGYVPACFNTPAATESFVP